MTVEIKEPVKQQIFFLRVSVWLLIAALLVTMWLAFRNAKTLDCDAIVQRNGVQICERILRTSSTDETDLKVVSGGSHVQSDKTDNVLVPTYDPSLAEDVRFNGRTTNYKTQSIGVL